MGHKHKNQKKRGRKREDSDSEEEVLKNPKPPKAQRKSGSGGVQFSKIKPQEHTSSPECWKMSFIKCFWSQEPLQDISDELKSMRKSIGVLVKGVALRCPPPILALEDSNVPVSFRTILSKLSIKKPSPIQMQSWPAILAGCNVLGIAPTGSGKTLAFCLPMIPHILHQIPAHKTPSVASPIALVVVPTRELAIQVATVVKKFKASTGINCLPVYGGHDRDQQLELLEEKPNMHVIVATPGRLIDMVTTGNISLERVTYLVIDEADRMLALGFEEQLTLIGSRIRPDRQILLFTATFPGRLRDASTKWMKSHPRECNDSNGEDGAAADDEDNTVIIRVNTVEFRSETPAEIATGNIPTTTRRDTEETEEQSGKQPSLENKSSNNPSSSPTTTTTTTVTTTVTAVSTDGNEVRDNAKSAKEDPRESSSKSHASSSMSLTLNRSIEQSVHVCASHKKPRLLINFVTKTREKEKAEKLRQGGPMLIFCTKIKTVNFVANFLTKNGVIGVQQLHGQLPQQRREGVLAEFKAGKILTVVATDVAARGIHIKRLKYVVNYDFPGSLEQYCHRVGRTGRKEGETGYSYSLLTRNLAPLAEDLVSLLRNCDQVVEPNLELLVSDYKNGLVDCEVGDDEDDVDGGEEDDDDNDDQRDDEIES